jgi:hypothetical protein
MICELFAGAIYTSSEQSTSWPGGLFDPEVTTPSHQLLPMPPPTIHDTFGQGDTTTAFSTLLGVLVVVVLLMFLVLKGVPGLAVGPYGV